MIQFDLFDLLTVVSNGITTPFFIYAYMGFILLVFLVVLLRFYLRVRPLKRALNKALSLLNNSKTMEEFAAEFPEFDDHMSDEPVLNNPWREFKETLLFPGEDLSDDTDIVHNTHPATYFFSRESIIAPKLDLRFYNAFPGILTALGILGTFIGLVAGIYLASGGLAADDISEAKIALNNLLSGASLAFLTSIAGLLTSMVASALEKRSLHRLDGLVDNFVIELDRRVKRLPAEKIQASTYRESQQQTKALQSFTNDLAVKFAEVLEEKIRIPMGESMDLLLESLDSLRNQQSKSSDELLTKLISEFSESISGAAGNEMRQFAETLNQLNEVFAEQVQSGAQAQRMTQELLDKAVETIQSCVTEMSSATEKNRQLMTEVNSILSLARESQAEMAATIVPLKVLAESVTKSSETGVEVAGIMKDCAVDLSTAVENLAEIEDQVSGAWRDYQTRFEGVDEHLAKTFDRLHEGLEAYGVNLKNYLLEVESQTSKIVTHLAGGTKGLEEAVEELADVMARREAV